MLEVWELGAVIIRGGYGWGLSHLHARRDCVHKNNTGAMKADEAS